MQYRPVACPNPEAAVKRFRGISAHHGTDPQATRDAARAIREEVTKHRA